MGRLFCSLSHRGQREAGCTEWHGQAKEKAEQNPTGVTLCRHPPRPGSEGQGRYTDAHGRACQASPKNSWA